MNVDVIKSYLVSLGFQVEHSELRKFEDALRNATNQVAAATTGAGGMAALFAKAGTVVTGVLTAIASGTVGLMDNVAASDLGMQVWARRMYMSTDAARSLRTATDALGYSLEDIIWGPKELQERFAALIEDQKRLQKEVGPDFENQMRRVRDIRFEFTRMGVTLQYMSMEVVKDLSRALFGDEDSLERKLKEFNDYLITNLPQIAQTISEKVVPVIRDMGDVAKDLYHILKTINWKEIADDIVLVSHALAAFFDFLAAHPLAAKLLLGGAGGGALGSVIPGVGTGIGAAAGASAALGVDAVSKGMPKWLLGTGALGPLLWELFGGGNPGATGSLSPISSLHKSIRDKIIQQANMMGVDPALALAVAHQESGMRERDRRGNLITSPVGAQGVFQLMPGTAKSLGVDATDEDQNIYGGVRYLRDLLSKYKGDVNQALKEYGGFVKTDPSAYINSVRGQMHPTSVQVDVGGIHINQPNATPEQIHRAVGDALDKKLGAQVQSNLIQLGGSYA